MLANEDLLEHFTKIFSSTKALANDTVRKQTELFASCSRLFPHIGEHHRTIVRQPVSPIHQLYLASPTPTTPGRSPLSVLAADSLLLQALWQITMCIATWITERKNP